MKRFTFFLAFTFLLNVAFNLSATGQTNSIPLNKGEKWKVDQSTATHVGKMQEIAGEFTESKIKDPQKLQSQLKEQISFLVKSCRMKGESHDALHHWLHPYMKLVDDLENAESADSPQVTAVLNHLESFNNYFE